MFLIDSNIIIYSYSNQYEYLRSLFFKEAIFVSEITRVEVLGYHKLTNEEESYFQDIFSFIPIIFPSQQNFDTSITVRKTYNLKLGDSIIAATALVHDLSIYTRNLSDFEKTTAISCINPII
jgi:predicted nucleic acid-binding protein